MPPRSVSPRPPRSGATTRFLAERERVHELGFDSTFVRMWEFYLAYCEAGFAAGALGDAQLRLARV
jgi:cyclopropane-fatty-acyl-phospholipid synthase